MGAHVVTSHFCTYYEGSEMFKCHVHGICLSLINALLDLDD